jgi:hypothetical protein
VKLVRVLTESPAEATALVSFLDSRGFVVQTTDRKSDLFSPSADFEIDLTVMPLPAAFQMAHGLVPDKPEVFVVPEMLTESAFGEASDVPLWVVDLPAGSTHRSVPISATPPTGNPEHGPPHDAMRLSHVIDKQSNKAASVVGEHKARVNPLGRNRPLFASVSQLASIALGLASIATIMFLRITQREPIDLPSRRHFQIAVPVPIKRELPAHDPPVRQTRRYPVAATIPQRLSMPRLHKMPPDDEEVVVHHYDRPASKPAVAELPGGNQ